MRRMNVDEAELEKFAQVAHQWWDPNGELRTLHDINPLRLDYIDRIAGLRGKRVLDVGCGGGILAEAMAARGAMVTGIDLSEQTLKVARLHLLESRQQVDYQTMAPERYAAAHPAQYDIVTCMEMLEHVPDPQSIVRACAQAARTGGWVFFSTLNRNLKAYLMAVVGAEYMLDLLPRGTHDYGKFIKPSELSRLARGAGLSTEDLTGVAYNPFNRTCTLVRDAGVNYMLCCRAG
ncbi:MAG: bifunctional 2-polyprenyl-6-hydroxyphenol methylase/3-demethylubiquinol 3-O-methyltransferase UbiG [Burkholderiales bacterium]